MSDAAANLSLDEKQRILGWRGLCVPALHVLADVEPGKDYTREQTAPVEPQASTLDAAGLRALDYLGRGERAPYAWKAEQLALVEPAKTQKAQLLLMVAPSAEKLDPGQRGQNPLPTK